MDTRLYKAERLNGGGVVKGYYCKVGETITGEASPEGVKHFIIPVGTTSLEGAVEIDVKTLAQYTGVKDKNGKEICQYNECRLELKDGYVASGYIDFIYGSYAFVQYVTGTVVFLKDITFCWQKQYKIEVVADWYDKILLKEKCDDKDDGKSESEEDEEPSGNKKRPFVTVIDHTADETTS